MKAPIINAPLRLSKKDKALMADVRNAVTAQTLQENLPRETPDNFMAMAAAAARSTQAVRDALHEGKIIRPGEFDAADFKAGHNKSRRS
jgi:hypothetical protein